MIKNFGFLIPYKYNIAYYDDIIDNFGLICSILNFISHYRNLFNKQLLKFF